MGLIHLDAGVIIGFLDAQDAHHDAARATLTDALGNGDRLGLASSTLAECLVGAARTSEEAVSVVRRALDRLPAAVVDLNAEIATEAAFLRARHRSLRLPDALVIATAQIARADRLVTTDGRWPTAEVMMLTLEVQKI